MADEAAMTDSLVEVTQADRDAFVAYENARPIPLTARFARRVLRGECDGDYRLQAFARHRLASEQSSQAQIAAMREALEKLVEASWSSRPVAMDEARSKARALLEQEREQ